MPKVNKVEYFGETLIDLTADTVTPETLDEGVTAHSADGEAITGTRAVMNPDDYVKKSGDTMGGMLVAQGNSEYTTAQVRNIILLEEGNTDADSRNGNVIFVYQS